MIEKIKTLLKESGADEYKIVMTGSKGAESYFIGNKLEMKRQLEIQSYEVTVYRDFTEDNTRLRGSMKIRIHPTHAKDDIRELIGVAMTGAASARNPWYPLPDPDGSMELHRTSLEEKTVSEWVSEIGKIIFREASGTGVTFNATEIFLTRKKNRIVNSRGIDVSWTIYSGLVELVTTTTGDDGKEVERFDQFHFSDFEPVWFSRKIREQIKATKDRAAAVPLPALKEIPVILTSGDAKDFFSYYLAKTTGELVYEKISGFEPGKAVQSGDAAGDKITMEILPYLKNSPFNTPVDEDGVVCKGVILIEEGVTKNYRTDVRMAHYLSHPLTGNMRNISVKPGRFRKDQLDGKKYLEIQTFSDFNVDPLSGSFGGEIRLAYYCDGKNLIPVTGGSISGVIEEIQDKILMSSEIISYESYQGPEFLYLEGVSIAGVLDAED